MKARLTASIWARSSARSVSHELAGTIAAVGRGVLRYKTGDRVMVPFVSGCGRCFECRSGNNQVCEAQFQPGFTHWGSFAEYVAIDFADQNLVHLPEDMMRLSVSSSSR